MQVGCMQVAVYITVWISERMRKMIEYIIN
ncbi:UNVERIFIED_ORG: hypothetical protein M2328_006443 [Rhodococcus erythropolis]